MKKLFKSILVTLIFSFLFSIHNAYSLQKKSSATSLSSLITKYTTLYAKAGALKKEGKFHESIEQFENSLKIAKRLGDKRKEIDPLQMLGLLYWNIGKLKESIDYYEKAFFIAKDQNIKEKINEFDCVLDIYHKYNEGKELRKQGNHKGSIKMFNEAIASAEKIRSYEHKVKCLRQLSITYLELEKLPEYHSKNQEALEIAKTLKHAKEQGRCLFNIGYFHHEYDNYSKALKNYNEALKIAEELDVKKDQTKCLLNMGAIHIQMGNYEKAQEKLQEALRIDRQLKNYEDVSKGLNNVGIILRRRGLASNNAKDLYKHLYEALEHFKECLKLARKIEDAETEVEALNNIGTVYTDLENYSMALRYFNEGYKKAEEDEDIEEMSMILNNIGIVYSNQERYKESTTYYERAIKLAEEKIGGGRILWEAYFRIANDFKKQKRYPEAFKNYRRSIRNIEALRSNILLEENKANYLGAEKRIDVYHNLIDLLVTLHKFYPEKDYDIEAFKHLERAKARAFLDSLQISEIDVSQDIPPQLLNEEIGLMNQITDLNIKLLAPEYDQKQKEDYENKLKELEDDYEALKRKIRDSSHAYAAIDPEPISLEKAQKKLLDNKTAFFEYCIGREHSYAFVITKKELKMFEVPKADDIKKMIASYMNAISDKEIHDFHIGRELFSMLVLPGLDKELEKLIFVPDDSLHYLPFETLISHEKETRWLIEDYTIAYAPSISSLDEIIWQKKSNKQKPKKDILALGDPYFGEHETEFNGDEFLQDYYSSSNLNFYRLQYSGREIDSISALFKKSKRDILKREGATEEQFKDLNLSNYKILHFATHGLIDNDNPSRSTIVLSLNNGKKEEDGLLQMREIFRLKLNCDLVTLSACQTGLGRLIEGEGIASLNRAFFYAGASSVLISLWPIADQASFQFMERFYTHLRSSESIMNALRKVKLEMIASDVLSHPYYWAPFIVTGDADKTPFYSFLKKLFSGIRRSPQQGE